MDLAIMQPYFFPYLGYFHLIRSVDKFVVYDDVNFINRGWINRNRIPINGEPHYFTIPLQGASQNSKINALKIVNDSDWKNKMLSMFKIEYAKALYKDRGLKILENVLSIESPLLVDYCVASLIEVKKLLHLETEIILSSSIYKNEHLKAEDRILDICKSENATNYLNLIGGRDLYLEENFNAINCDLSFIKSDLPVYVQKTTSFIPGLSILDIIFNCELDQIVSMMECYEVIRKKDMGD